MLCIAAGASGNIMLVPPCNAIELSPTDVPYLCECFLSCQGKGGSYCEFRVRVQHDRTVMFESAKYPLQFLNIQPNGRPGDPRSGDLADPNKTFVVYAKVKEWNLYSKQFFSSEFTTNCCFLFLRARCGSMVLSCFVLRSSKHLTSTTITPSTAQASFISVL